MITVEEVEKKLEEEAKETKTGETNGSSTGMISQGSSAKMLYPVYSYDRLEKKDSLKKIGRNDKCVCGSGKKFKKCCLPKINFQDIYELKQNERPVNKNTIEVETRKEEEEVKTEA